MLQNDPLRLPPFHFDADPDPTFHFDADPETAFQFDADPAFHFDADPDPASQNDADYCNVDPDPDPQHCRTHSYFYVSVSVRLYHCLVCIRSPNNIILEKKKLCRRIHLDDLAVVLPHHVMNQSLNNNYSL